MLTRQHLGASLQAIRKQRGRTQLEVAQACGLTRQQYANYEQGLSEINATMLVTVAQFLGVPPSIILGEIAMSEDDTFVAQYKALPESAREAVRKAAQLVLSIWTPEQR